MAQPTEYEQVTYNSPDGAQAGRTSTDLFSFYGAPPVPKNATATVASTYATTTNTTAVFGFASATDVSSLVHNVSTCITALKAYGLLT